MSRGRTGLIKAVKEIFREIKFFGDAEIATLKESLEAHKLQLEQLKQARQERQRREEALALLEMRNAVEHLQKMEMLLAQQDEHLEAAAEELARQAKGKLERDMTSRAMSVMQGISLQDVGAAEEEEVIGQHLQRLKAELEAAGRGQPTPSAAAAEAEPQQAAPAGGGGRAGRKRR